MTQVAAGMKNLRLMQVCNRKKICIVKRANWSAHCYKSGIFSPYIESSRMETEMGYNVDWLGRTHNSIDSKLTHISDGINMTCEEHSQKILCLLIWLEESQAEIWGELLAVLLGAK